jgi:hypothetical protein
MDTGQEIRVDEAERMMHLAWKAVEDMLNAL